LELKLNKEAKRGRWIRWILLDSKKRQKDAVDWWIHLLTSKNKRFLKKDAEKNGVLLLFRIFFFEKVFEKMNPPIHQSTCFFSASFFSF
jgi:hypothetical protein